MSFPYESSRRLDKAIERVMVGILRVGGWASVLVTFGIVITLVTESWPFFKAVPVGRLFTDRMWTPDWGLAGGDIGDDGGGAVRSDSSGNAAGDLSE